MKKVLIIVLALVLVLSFSACTKPTTPTPTPNPTNPTTPTTPTTGALKDGTYEGKGDKWQYGDESATVIVSGGKMSQITLRRLTTEGQEVNYEEWTGAEVAGQKRPNLKKFREDLAKAMIAKQGTDVDDVAGATVSSKNWKLAVQRALDQAKVK